MKRHRIADNEEPFLANEVVSQGFAATDEFLTKRLWDVGNTGPYGHRGDVTTLDEIIVRHGGEARTSRTRYVSLPPDRRSAVIEFLKTLQIVPMKSIAESPPNRLSPRLEALVDRWQLELGGSLLSQLIERADAAAYRAQATRDHLRSLVMRIEEERQKIPAQKLRSIENRAWLPERSELLSDKLHQTLRADAAETSQILESVEQVESALNDSYELAEHGLQLAAIANPGEAKIPIGHLEPSRLFSTVASLQSSEQRVAMLRELVAWCEDITFRVEQLNEQVAMAELRIEALASQELREKGGVGQRRD